jgi:hypothetical protein
VLTRRPVARELKFLFDRDGPNAVTEALPDPFANVVGWTAGALGPDRTVAILRLRKCPSAKRRRPIGAPVHRGGGIDLAGRVFSATHRLPGTKARVAEFQQ